MNLIFLEGERGHISQARDYDLATNNAFKNALFNRNEAIPTTRNNVEEGRNNIKERFREGS